MDAGDHDSAKIWPTSYLPNLRKDLGSTSSEEVRRALAHLRSDLSNADSLLDQHERSYVQTWLTRLFSSCTDETCLEEASNLLSLTDASPGLRKPEGLTHAYQFERPNGSVTINMQETHMRDADATGFRTWSSAIHLARRILHDPIRFLNLRSLAEGDERPLHVLEIGSGTGLAGIAAYHALHDVPRFHLVLSDRDPLTLDLLRHNVQRNCEELQRTTTRRSCQQQLEIRQLDWDAASPDLCNRFDIILGADIVYEPTHAALIHKVVCATLARRTNSIFVLLIPNRPSHRKDLEALETMFKTRSSVHSTEASLIIVQQEDIDVSSEDLYSYSHRMYSIRWQLPDDT